MDVILVHIPLLRAVIIKLDMLRFCTAFRMGVRAGIPMKEVISLSADICVNVYTRREVNKLQKALQNGEPLYAHMKQIRIFPEIMVRMFETGEKGGKLEETAEKIEEYFTDEVRSALSMLLRGLGILIYLAIIIFIGYNIIIMASGTLNRINDIVP
jgi:type II secretory pathway component PulF